jgi:hypothetical protein
LDVGNAVAIVVGLRASVLILEPVSVLGLVGAFVFGIQDPIAIVVTARAGARRRRRRRRVAIERRCVRAHYQLGARAFALGTAIVVFDAVPILLLERTRVRAIGDGVPIGVVRRRRPVVPRVVRRLPARSRANREARDDEAKTEAIERARHERRRYTFFWHRSRDEIAYDILRL